MIHGERFKSELFPRLKPLVSPISLSIALILLAWSLYNYQPAPNFYGGRAVYSLIVLSLLLALAGRVLLLHLLKVEATSEASGDRLRSTWRSLFLFDFTAPLYLAGAVIIGPPAAVLVALITQAFLQGYTLQRGFVSWREASYRIAATGLFVLTSAILYTWMGGAPRNYFERDHFNILAESRGFLGAFVAAILMTFLLALISLPILMQTNHSNISTAWRAYVQSPVLRFQVLVLSVSPLLPLADTFDDAAGELAWLFFLIPLFAISYMALNSARLSIRTSELQYTLEVLRNARRRQDELRDYASLITRAQEEERRRLARELHDDTAQALIALSLGLDGLRRAMLHSSLEESSPSDFPSRTPARGSRLLAPIHSLRLVPATSSGKLQLPEKDVEWLSSLQELADRTLEGVRRACRDLRPSVLDDLGLRAALEWLSDGSAARGVPCSFLCHGSPLSTTPEAEIAIFRIVQEALSNIWRHSHATHAEIELRYLPGLVQITVHDNGQGFTPNRPDHSSNHDSHTGLGLTGMRERAALVGATLKITSSPGEGCTIVLSLPLI